MQSQRKKNGWLLQTSQVLSYVTHTQKARVSQKAMQGPCQKRKSWLLGKQRKNKTTQKKKEEKDTMDKTFTSKEQKFIQLRYNVVSDDAKKSNDGTSGSKHGYTSSQNNASGNGCVWFAVACLLYFIIKLF